MKKSKKILSALTASALAFSLTAGLPADIFPDVLSGVSVSAEEGDIPEIAYEAAKREAYEAERIYNELSSRSDLPNNANESEANADYDYDVNYYVPIDEAHFPDPIFREYVRTNINFGNYYLYPAQHTWVTIEVDNMGISSLKGIEYITELTSLSCSGNQLTELDLSHNTELRMLITGVGYKSAVDSEGNYDPSIDTHHYNNITSLDLSNNTNLSLLYCDGNELTSLDLSPLTELKSLCCNYNDISELDLSNNTKLEFLQCNNTGLTTLDVSHNIALESLFCSSNRLTNLDVSHNTALTMLSCYNNQLTSIDVSNNTALQSLNLGDNQVINIDVSNNTALESLYCYNNHITYLDVSHNTALKTLSCGDTQITNLDLRNNTALEYLWCYCDPITSLDVSHNSALICLDCRYNQLTSIDLSHQPNISLSYLTNYGLFGNKPGFTVYGRRTVSAVPEQYVNQYRSQYDMTYIDLDDTPADPVESFVDRLYSKFFGRVPSNEEKQSHIEILKTMTAADDVRNFIYAPEFINRNVSNAEFVNIMYNVFFDRDAGTEGAGWVKALDNGCSRDRVFYGFISAGEFAQRCSEAGIRVGSVTLTQNRDKNPEVTAFVAQLYRNALGTADPDEAGLNGWTGVALEGGRASLADVAHGFIFSPQFAAQYTTNEQIVTQLYRSLFGREPDEGGKNAWLSAMANGASKEEVFDGFIGSLECSNYFDSFGI